MVTRIFEKKKREKKGTLFQHLHGGCPSPATSAAYFMVRENEFLHTEDVGVKEVVDIADSPPLLVLFANSAIIIEYWCVNYGTLDVNVCVQILFDRSF